MVHPSNKLFLREGDRRSARRFGRPTSHPCTQRVRGQSTRSARASRRDGPYGLFGVPLRRSVVVVRSRTVDIVAEQFWIPGDFLPGSSFNASSSTSARAA